MPLRIYVHIPFCQVRCAYCDFNTFAGLADLMPAYTIVLSREIELVGSEFPQHRIEASRQIHSIFFGGGTPRLLRLQLMQALQDKGLVDLSPAGVRLQKSARLVANQAFEMFV